MKIGIIGAGNIDGALTRRLRSLGHEVFVANSRGPESSAGLAKKTGAKSVSVTEAARWTQVVVGRVGLGQAQVVSVAEAKRMIEVSDLPR